MPNDKTNGKRGNYKVNAQRQKDKLANSGHYTIHPIYLQSVLTLREYALLETIRHEIETGTNPISYSILEIETGFTRKQISEAKKALICLGFITSIRETRLGGLYKVNTSEIVKIVEKLNTCFNRVEHLRIADKFRASKKLEPQNTVKIEQFAGSSFDTDNVLSVHNKERYEPIPEPTPEANKKREKRGKTGNKKTNPVTTPEANTTQIPVQTIPEKEVKPFPKELTYYLYQLNNNETDKRKGNDIYYNQSKVAYLTGFKNHTNEYEPVFDGIFWKVKPNNNLNISVRALPGNNGNLNKFN
jgi:hypothetical protein